ncbi:MAG: hypothetical protein N2D54_04500 [Chloroflexota bacterium]
MRSTNTRGNSQLVFKTVGMAMGAAVIVLKILGSVEADTLFMLLGVGLFSFGISVINKGKNS